MKKVALLFAFCLSVIANAQTFKIGPSARFQVNSPTNANTKVGFELGVQGEYSFRKEKGIFMEASLMLDGKNWKSQGYFDNITLNSKEWSYTTYGLNIPINVGYRFHLTKSFNLLASVGPYFEIGFAGKEKSNANGNETTVSSNPYKDCLMNRFNWGLGLRLGGEINNHFQINAYYNFGLKEIHKPALDSKHRTFMLGVSYMF